MRAPRNRARLRAAGWRSALAVVLALLLVIGAAGFAAAAPGSGRDRDEGARLLVDLETPAPACEAEAPLPGAVEELAEAGVPAPSSEEPCPPALHSLPPSEAGSAGAGAGDEGSTGSEPGGGPGPHTEAGDGRGQGDDGRSDGASAAPSPKVVTGEPLEPRPTNGGTAAPAKDAPGADGKEGGEDRNPKTAAPGPEEQTSDAASAALSTAGLLGASPLALGQVEVPPLLLPVYQACGSEYEVPWQVLASINKIESGFGANMGPSSAGAIGPMQFMPSTWAADGLDANGDGREDAWEPFDAICAAARYLHESGGEAHLYRAVFAYNHADWYVAEVLREARNFAALPANLLASLTSLAEGETVPVPAATGSGYAAGLDPVLRSTPSWLTGAPLAPPAAGEEGPAERSLEIDAPAGSPVLAVADSTVVHRGRNAALGRYLILRDPYGARYTYSHLGAIHRVAVQSSAKKKKKTKIDSTGGRRRLSAFPNRHGATEPASLHPVDRTVPMVALRKGTKVRAGTVIAEVAARPDPGIDFGLQPDGSEPIDPQAFVSLWRRGGAGGIFAAPVNEAGPRGPRADPAETLLLGADALRRRALRDPLLDLPRCEREALRAGRMAPRAVAALEFLTASGGRRVAVAPRSCRGDGEFAMALAAVGGHALARHGAPTPLGRSISRQTKALQGAMAPQRVVALGGGSAAQALITSAPAGAGAADSSSLLALDFSPPQSATLVDGKAVAPVDAPPAVQAMIAAANQISTTPYIWGGGHGSWVSAGYDCSGSVSYVLHAAGLLATPETSGTLAAFGGSGAGRWVTIYANATHTYAEIAGLRWDTVGDANGTGPRWHLDPPYPEGFVVRHPEGL